MRQEDYMKELVNMIEEKKLWYRMISLDLETDCRNKQFLSNERILAIGVAYFNKDYSITTRNFILEDDSEKSEISLLQEFDEYLKSKHPLVVTGYFLRQYDIPLLAIKKSYYSKQRLAFWKIGNLIDNTFHLELSSQIQLHMQNKCNERFRIWSLDELIHHECFKELPLMRSKNLVKTNKENKGELIYNLWKEKDPTFQEYLKGDVHDPLMLVREIFKD